MGTVFLAAFLAATAATWLVSRVVTRVGVLDRPNVRSSHAAPTPTAGGLGLIAGLWAGVGVAAVYGCEGGGEWRPFVASSLILLVLVLDEIRPMGRLTKLAAQSAAAAVPLLYGLALDRLQLPYLAEIELGVMAYPITFVWLVAVQNVFNFMDGIDGIAGLEAFLVAGLIYLVARTQAPGFTAVPLACAGASAGFLVWNLPKSRVFMGDVGSHLLGIVTGTAALVLHQEGVPFFAVPLAMGVFLFDTAYTLARRTLRGENITKAHRFHLYQRLNATGWSHGRVDAVYGGLTILFCGSAYLYATGSGIAACVAGVAGTLLLVSGTIWVEHRWRQFGSSSQAE